ncbi:MAG: hypothetical protein OXN89_05295 [Bryobacterales bacterium]|nr:hypothetical protein [Bryobacterales bacterium]
MSKRFRCYAYGRGSDWQAICVDVDVAVDGASSEEVKDSLGASVELFLSAVADLSLDDQREALSHTTPRYICFKLALLARLPWKSLRWARPEGFSLSLSQPAQA